MNVIDDIKSLKDEKSASDKPIKELSEKTILVVEDEKPLANLLEQRLLEEGFKVVTAENGEQGLEIATTHHPDVIILDLLMPIMDGKAMLSKLRAVPECKKIPVIILTNAGDVDNVRDTLTYLDALEFLIKSNVTIDQIIEKVKTFGLATYM
jgi:CheY-like chemotaxis protein